MKRLEKRLEAVEAWAKDLDRGSGPAQTMDNMNWLVGQTRLLGDRLQEAEKAVGQMQGAIQQNNDILQAFLDKHDMIPDWQLYLEELQKEAEDADEKPEAEEVSSREEAEAGEEVGKEDA